MTASIAFDAGRGRRPRQRRAAPRAAAGRPGSVRRMQATCGIVLLEALIAVLVLSLGALGIAGLAARALRDAGDAHWRAEAAGLAMSTLARMWTEDPATLTDRYDSSSGGAGFRDVVAAASRLPGVSPTRNAPIVAVQDGAFGSSPRVTITLFWQAPGDATAHRYAIEQVVASR